MASPPAPTIGVLALQGAFIEHLAKFLELGVACREVRTAEELAGCCALVVPGGESTAMGLLAARQGLVRGRLLRRARARARPHLSALLLPLCAVSQHDHARARAPVGLARLRPGAQRLQLHNSEEVG